MNSKSFKLSPVAGLFPLLLAAPAIAEPQANPIVTESGLSIAPFLNFTYGHDDNLALTTDNEESSSFSIIEPGVKFLAEPASQRHELTYRLRRGDYFSSREDDFTDHFVGIRSGWDLNTRHRLGFQYDFARTHNSRGGNEATLGQEYSKYNTNDVNFGYSFGAQEAQGRINVNLGWGDKSYRNLRNTTQYQDWEEVRFDTSFLYRVMPKTSLVFEVLANDRDYDITAPGRSSRDSKHYFAYVGATWDATAKIQGRAKLGYQNKDFNDSSREDFDSISWDIGLSYDIKEYSTVSLDSNRKATDPDGAGDYIDASNYRLNWDHDWSSFVSTRLTASLLNEDYSGSVREDDTESYALNLNYDFKRWLTFTIGARHENRDSSLANFDYDQDVFYFVVQGVM